MLDFPAKKLHSELFFFKRIISQKGYLWYFKNIPLGLTIAIVDSSFYCSVINQVNVNIKLNLRKLKDFNK